MDECKAYVENIPPNAEKYIIVKLVQNKLWYYGSWKNEAQAKEISKLVDGVVVERAN